MHFNSFPDDCILLIFGRLPLRTLVQIEVVCHKWKLLQTIACRDRHSLFLHVGTFSMIFHYEFDGEVNMLELVNQDKPMFVSPKSISKLHGLELDGKLSGQTCDWFVRKFPNISSLHMSISNFKSNCVAKYVISLFTALSSRLSTLKLNNSHKTDYMSLLVPINNRLLALKNLTLCLGIGLYGNKKTQNKIDLPILSRLNRFHFDSLDQPDAILESLVRYGQPNESLKEIRLPKYLYIREIDEKALFNQFRALSPDLTCRCTNLLKSVHLSKLPLLELKTLFRQFPNQQTQIEIDKDEMKYSLEDLINSLALLKHLISFSFIITKNIPDSVQLNYSLPQLNSILMLSLSWVNSHTLLSQFNIAWIFPNIQIVVLRPRTIEDLIFCMCYKCHSNYVKGNEDKQFRACLRLLLEPLKQCTKLRKIDFKQPPQYNIEDIVEECLGK